MTLDSICNSCNVTLLFPILSVEGCNTFHPIKFYDLPSLVKLVKIAIRPIQAIWPVWKFVPLFSYFPAGSIVLKCLMGVEGLVACMGLFRQILLAVDNKCIIVTITLTGLLRQILLDVNDKCRSVTIISFIIVTNWQTWPSCVDGQHKSLQAVCRFPHQHLRRQLKHTVEINHIQSHPVWTV